MVEWGPIFFISNNLPDDVAVGPRAMLGVALEITILLPLRNLLNPIGLQFWYWCFYMGVCDWVKMYLCVWSFTGCSKRLYFKYVAFKEKDTYLLILLLWCAYPDFNLYMTHYSYITNIKPFLFLPFAHIVPVCLCVNIKNKKRNDYGLVC